MSLIYSMIENKLVYDILSKKLVYDIRIIYLYKLDRTVFRHLVIFDGSTPNIFFSTPNMLLYVNSLRK